MNLNDWTRWWDLAIWSGDVGFGPENIIESKMISSHEAVIIAERRLAGSAAADRFHYLLVE